MASGTTLTLEYHLAHASPSSLSDFKTLDTTKRDSAQTSKGHMLFYSSFQFTLFLFVVFCIMGKAERTEEIYNIFKSLKLFKNIYTKYIFF